MDIGQDSKGMGMTEQEERRARERKEIAARIASFKATRKNSGSSAKNIT
jgi:hypothetical protein